MQDAGTTHDTHLCSETHAMWSNMPLPAGWHVGWPSRHCSPLLTGFGCMGVQQRSGCTAVSTQLGA
jgi:hypothetical protein